MDMTKLERFADLVRQSQREEQARHYPDFQTQPDTRIIIGKRYAKVDVSDCGHWSGKYMVDEDGNIFGIKGYGVIHRGHRYGNLDEIESWNWSGSTARKRRTMADALEESAQHYHDSGTAFRT